MWESSKLITTKLDSKASSDAMNMMLAHWEL